MNGIFSIIIHLIRRRNPLKYAKFLGVTIGEGSRLVDNPSWGSEPYLITIGNHVLISSGVSFNTHDGATWLFRESGIFAGTVKYGKIKVGNNCFIGTRSIILPNVVIGDNSIIAAGSVVASNVPDGEVWGGVPARFIKKTEDYARQCYENRIEFDKDNLKKNKKQELLKRLCQEK